MADITPGQLQEYANAPIDDLDFVTTCTDTAIDLVAKYCGDAQVPDIVRQSAQLEAGLKLIARRQAPNGAWSDGTGAAIYAPRNVMITAGPLLDPYLPLRGL